MGLGLMPRLLGTDATATTAWISSTSACNLQLNARAIMSLATVNRSELIQKAAPGPSWRFMRFRTFAAGYVGAMRPPA